MSALVGPDGKKRCRVMAAVPCQDQVDAGFALDLAGLAARTALSDTTLTFAQVRGAYLPQQRCDLVQIALDKDATHILWLDSDMRFPDDALLRLVERDKPIVAANYPTRRPPFLPTAEHREKGYLFTTADASGLEEVSHAGMGLMLVDLDVYRALDKPWFALGYDPTKDGWAGEDVFFCRNAGRAKFPVLIDHDLSHEVRHSGQMIFTQRHAELTRHELLRREQEIQAVRGAVSGA